MKNIKRITLTIFILIAALALVGCGAEKNAGKTGGEKETVTITHELGEMTVDKEPKRVVIFDYGILDALDTLGIDIVGLPKQSLPGYLDKYKDEKYIDVGSLKEPNFEKIYEAEPDLVIIAGRQAELYDEFEKIAPTVYLNLDGGDYMNSFKHNMEVLGQIFDKEDILAEHIDKIEERIKELNEEAQSSGRTGLFIMANDGNLSAYGLGSRFGILHKEFGVEAVDNNIDSSTHGQKISFEYIMEKDPDYIFVMDRAVIAGGDISAKQVMDNDLIKSTKAYENDRIIYLDAHIWYVSSGGLTSTLKMVEEIEDALEK